MQLRFDPQEIGEWARRYCKAMSPEEEALMGLRCARLAEEGLDLPHLARLARWKAPMGAHWIGRNEEPYVRELTRFALSTPSERARIEVLTLLNGVGWPMASVILHFYHAERYPILDVRALWSVGAELTHRYDFAFWWDYVQFCREEAERAKVDMRTLDRALWQFSKAMQPAQKT